MNAVIQVLGVSLGDLFWLVHLFSHATRICVHRHPTFALDVVLQLIRKGANRPYWPGRI